jgi:hypothetical protein
MEDSTKPIGLTALPLMDDVTYWVLALNALFVGMTYLLTWADIPKKNTQSMDKIGGKRDTAI